MINGKAADPAVSRSGGFTPPFLNPIPPALAASGRLYAIIHCLFKIEPFPLGTRHILVYQVAVYEKYR
jgi:hypothetical protein